ncbi:pyridoxamine 5'-phosphate oxidase [Nocardioides mangrovicus]|uniref:Pyridoxamine 5'-phosphate oxidase n=1 Tax=Nocardioides mangrovicus TaxID=2478913 RepID=A0A3L8P3I2_9ACTN|nr:pyridoxamine 5'-phosphate oxidase family protein [Nocardioides mangrovicus]RLV49651.1 pyridoxamine 5'-phosphate oxidase [Nocardioides mangrovicus]
MSEENAHDTVIDLMRQAHVAMLTHVDATGSLVSHPMATQDVDYDGTLRFIARRSSDKVQDLLDHPAVNVSYAGSGSWLSVAGTAKIVNDEAKLAELWDTFTDAWLEGGPEDPENVLIEVEPGTAEYWSAPGGSKVTQLVNLVRTRLSGERAEGENEVVDL